MLTLLDLWYSATKANDGRRLIGPMVRSASVLRYPVRENPALPRRRDRAMAYAFGDHPWAVVSAGGPARRHQQTAPVGRGRVSGDQGTSCNCRTRLAESEPAAPGAPSPGPVDGAPPSYRVASPHTPRQKRPDSRPVIELAGAHDTCDELPPSHLSSSQADSLSRSELPVCPAPKLFAAR